MLSLLGPPPICREDFTDDRLADILHVLSQDQAWQESELFQLSEWVLKRLKAIETANC
jgi:hypothetical protein